MATTEAADAILNSTRLQFYRVSDNDFSPHHYSSPMQRTGARLIKSKQNTTERAPCAIEARSRKISSSSLESDPSKDTGRCSKSICNTVSGRHSLYTPQIIRVMLGVAFPGRYFECWLQPLRQRRYETQGHTCNSRAFLLSYLFVRRSA